jgi:hypothetical protein
MLDRSQHQSCGDLSQTGGQDRRFNVGTIFNISSSRSDDPDELAKASSLPQTQAASLTQPNSPSMAGLRSLSS